MAHASQSPDLGGRFGSDGPLVATIVLALVGIVAIVLTEEVRIAIAGLPLVVVVVGLVRLRAPPIIYLGVGLYVAVLIGGWALIGMPYGLIGWVTALVLAATLFLAVARFTVAMSTDAS